VLIRQLVENLVGNALKYTRPGESPEVTVSACQSQDGRVLVTVADRGLGIPEEAQDWIFEPFRRAHHGDIPGSGLGLSTCRRIVERHGGSIRARSRHDGPGAVFEFDLMGTR
jgi:signal transduction histidine kinase